MFGLNQNQSLAIGIGIASFLGGSTAQLTTLFGTAGASYIGSACALAAGVLAVILTVTTGQGATVKQVLAMPGVERIAVNGQANATLATMAVDKNQDKIAPTQAAEAAVTATAKAAS